MVRTADNICPKERARARSGFTTIEMCVALSILVMAVFPLGYSYVLDARMLRAGYQRAVAIEIVDGEMEVLAAGGWRQIPEGSAEYRVHSKASANLPPGRFSVTREKGKLRLEWRADVARGVGVVAREVALR